MNLLREFLSDLTIEFGYVEDSPSLDDFNTPMKRSLVFNSQLKINSDYISAHKYYMSQTIVETESGMGSLTSDVTEKRGIKLESSNVNLTSRRI